MKTTRSLKAGVVAAMVRWAALGLFAAGCGTPEPAGGEADGDGGSSEGDVQGSGMPDMAAPEIGATRFQSIDPTAPPGSGSAGHVYADAAQTYDTSGGGADSGAPSEPGGDDDEAAREIVEADVLKIEGDRLFALSQYRGLAVVDVSNPDDLRLLGRMALDGYPFEMYLRDGVAYVLLTSFWSYSADEAGLEPEWRTTSRIVALDVQDPAAIAKIGDFDLAGDISDSRMVGDVLYAVAHEDGWCWLCSGVAQTTITALTVADPGAIAVVDRLTFADEDSYGWGGPRSVMATSERLYVSGSDWEAGHSTVQVVDISDPAGALQLGAQVAVAGQIQSRWQLDEYEGILRVVSKPTERWDEWDAWDEGDEPVDPVDVPDVPVVETFRVVSADEIEPLGRLELVLPRPEELMSVRFDGPRGYAVTFEQTDPLFTIDLSDPAEPVQRGALEIPGWLYHMEPRGDRLVALGYDWQADSMLAVSLFDVSDLDHPTQLARVNFGGTWGYMVEDQDRIHKVFRILDELGLILMPFQGWTWDDETGAGRYASGVQLIDFTRDGLTERGVAPHTGFARRAFVHAERLFALSDERVETFDFSDRDRPVKTGSLVLARTVQRLVPVGQAAVAELVADWWTADPELLLMPANDPDAAEPLGRVDLSEWDDGSSDLLYQLNEGRLFAHDAAVTLAWPDWSCDNAAEAEACYLNGGRTAVARFDVTNPQAPRLTGRQTFDFAFDPWGFYGYFGWGNSILGAGKPVVQLGGTLVFGVSRTLRDPDNHYRELDTTHSLEIVDTSGDGAPRLAASVALPGIAETASLQAVGTFVLLSHREESGETAGVARFFLDRVDVSDPDAPRLLPPVNVPGSLVGFAPATGLLVTVDYQAVRLEENEYGSCPWGTRGYAQFIWDEASDACYGLQRSLNLARVVGDEATLLDRLTFAEAGIDGARLDGERLFVTLDGPPGDCAAADGCAPDGRGRLVVVTGLGEGQLAVAGMVPLGGPYSRLLAARAGHAFVVSDYPPALSDFTAHDPAAPALAARTLLTGYNQDLALGADALFSANGAWGAQRIPFAE